MRKRNAVICLTAILILAMAFAVYAEEKSLKSYTDQTLKFSIKYPNDWKIQKEEGKNDRVYFASSDGTAVVAVNVMNPAKKMSAKEFLNAMEQKLGTKNVTGEKDRPFDEETCETMNVDEGYSGEFVIRQDGKDVYSIINVFIKEKKIYFLMISSPLQDDLGKFENILSSFRAL